LISWFKATLKIPVSLTCYFDLSFLVPRRPNTTTFIQPQTAQLATRKNEFMNSEDNNHTNTSTDDGIETTLYANTGVSALQDPEQGQSDQPQHGTINTEGEGMNRTAELERFEYGDATTLRGYFNSSVI
jgi:hypothetical protein